MTSLMNTTYLNSSEFSFFSAAQEQLEQSSNNYNLRTIEEWTRSYHKWASWYHWRTL